MYATSFFADSAGSTTSEVVPRYTTVSQVALTKTGGLGQSGLNAGTTISTALGAIKSGTTSFTKLITTLSTSTVVGTTTYTSTTTSDGIESVIIVTDVVDLYTTICPVTATQTGAIVANSFTTSTAAGFS